MLLCLFVLTKGVYKVALKRGKIIKWGRRRDGKGKGKGKKGREEG